VQLWPEISMSIIGQDFMREGDVKSGIEVFKLNLLAHPDSADANDSLADAYLKDRQKNLARQHAKKALEILDAHHVPASSWTDTEQYRGEIHRDAEKVLKELRSPDHN
jgi:Flp pilus assembly protein TadD